MDHLAAPGAGPHPDGRHRTVIGVHLVLQRGSTVLLGLRAGTGWRDCHYHVPAGHLEAGETATECAVREAAEELGITIDPGDLHLVHTVHHATVTDDPRIQLFFRVQRWTGEPANREPDRCAALTWASLDDLPQPMVDFTAVALREIRSGGTFSIVGWGPDRDHPSHPQEPPLTTERPVPPLTGGERDTLRGFLDFHRATLAMKCDGLTDEELRTRSSPPSTLSLLGLVRHMAEVERTWFRKVVNAEDIPLVWSDQGDYQVAYDASTATRSEAFAAWQAEVEHSRRIERQADSLDLVVHNPRWGEDVSLRLVMLHVLLEYARHNGHADFLREAIDGTVGP